MRFRRALRVHKKGSVEPQALSEKTSLCRWEQACFQLCFVRIFLVLRGQLFWGFMCLLALPTPSSLSWKLPHQAQGKLLKGEGQTSPSGCLDKAGARLSCPAPRAGLSRSLLTMLTAHRSCWQRCGDRSWEDSECHDGWQRNPPLYVREFSAAGKFLYPVELLQCQREPAAHRKIFIYY